MTPAPDPSLLRAAIDAMPARVCMVDAGGRFQHVNQEFLTFIGLESDRVVGRPVAEIVGAAAAETLAPLIERALSGRPGRFEGWLTYPGGVRAYVRQVLQPVPVEFGGAGFLLFTSDLTATATNEVALASRIEALRESEASNAAVIRSSLDCIVVIDEGGCVVEFNPAAEATFGYERAETIGRPIADLIVPPTMRDAHRLGMERYLRTGQAAVLGRRVELEAMRRDGSILPVELSIVELQVRNGRSFAAHLRDLTIAKAAESEIEQQRTQLHQSEKLSVMGSLLAGVAHELNNPLAIILAQATLLRNKAETDDLRRRAERMHAAAERAARIIKGFLSVARQKPPERRPSCLNGIVQAGIEMTAYGRKSAGIELTAELGPDGLLLDADPDTLGQVAANLLVNATQALADRPGPRRVWVSTTYRPDRTELAVADNGPGVPDEIRRRIFDPYFTTKAVGVGTGIGLSISRSIVEAHGGTLAAENRPGGGALFRVTLPAANRGTRTLDEAEHLPADAARVLVVDDEADVAESLAEMLEDLGHRTVTADSPSDALVRAGDRSITVVFADFRMPSMSGIQLHRALRDARPGLEGRLVLVTGDTIGGSDEIAQEMRDHDLLVLEKPFTAEDVRAVMGRVREAGPDGDRETFAGSARQGSEARDI